MGLAQFRLDRDMPQVDAKLGPIVNGAVKGDFSQFKARGGKLIIYQGWADPIVSPYQTVALYKKLTREFGPDQDFARLFMAPRSLSE
jgi:feruloyl esterase